VLSAGQRADRFSQRDAACSQTLPSLAGRHLSNPSASGAIFINCFVQPTCRFGTSADATTATLLRPANFTAAPNSIFGGIATHVFARQPDGSLKLKLHTFN
jgi:hypothetical protein